MPLANLRIALDDQYIDAPPPMTITGTKVGTDMALSVFMVTFPVMERNDGNG
jgi:hypothetical protein